MSWREADAVEKIGRQIDELAKMAERMQFEEYLRYAKDTRRMLRNHFFGGLARGVGMAVGFTVLGALLVVLLQRLAVDNMPWLGSFLADLIREVQTKLGQMKG